MGEIYSKIPKAAIEISHSRKGAHNWCVYQGELPAKDITTVNIGGLKVELFLANKFIALGDQETAAGDAGTDYTAELLDLVAKYFRPKAATDTGGERDWNEGHELGWELPDDEELIRIALNFAPSAAAAFLDKVTFADLWTRNVAKLSVASPDDKREFDESAADFALAGKLSWLTGNDCPRIERLMKQSALYRDKYEREDYLCVRDDPASFEAGWRD